jgi:hypothetical protein
VGPVGLLAMLQFAQVFGFISFLPIPFVLYCVVLRYHGGNFNASRQFLDPPPIMLLIAMDFGLPHPDINWHCYSFAAGVRVICDGYHYTLNDEFEHSA